MKITAIPNPTNAAPSQASKMIIKAKTQPEHIQPVLANPEPPVQAAAPGHEQTSVEQAPEATKALSPQYAELARKEKALRKLQQDFKAEQEAWKAERAAADSKKVTPSSDANLSYEQLVQQAQANTSVDPQQARIDALEARLAQLDKSQTERESNEYQQAIKVIESDVTLLVNSDPNFETIKATGSIPEVVKLVEQVFKAEGVIMSIEEASQAIEDKLVERKLAEIQSLSKLKKLQAKLSPAPAADAQSPSDKPATKTLTNAMGVQRPLTARERAILAFNNQLK